MNIPAPHGREYLPYQLKGIRYALGARGTILADEMGLGKTIQAIGVLNAIPGEVHPITIVCPAGLKLNWQNELYDWLLFPGRNHVSILSYNEAESYEAPKDHVFIADEAHYIKHAQTKRSQCVARLGRNASRILAITGTPMENSPIEIWPLLCLVAPDVWNAPRPKVTTLAQRQSHPGEGPAFWEFAARYCDLKETKFRVKGRWRTALDFSGASNLPELQLKLRQTCMVRRMKKDVLRELPEKRRQVIDLDVKHPRTDWYRDKFLAEISERNYEEMVKALFAKKILFEEYSKVRHEQALAKVDACVSFIADALDCSEKIIVFAHHSDVIHKLFDNFKEGYNPVLVTGKTHVADRGAAVRKFQTDPSCRLFFGSIGAAGVGITLTAASHVIFAELDPVPGRMTQAEDRAHRIGQRDMVLVQHLVVNGSLCARMAKILVRKQAVLNEALDTLAGLEVER